MTFEDLKNLVAELEENDVPDHAEVSIAMQPSYPMVGACRGIVLCHGDNEEVSVQIVAGDNEAYGSKGVHEAASGGYLGEVHADEDDTP